MVAPVQWCGRMLVLRGVLFAFWRRSTHTNGQQNEPKQCGLFGGKHSALFGGVKSVASKQLRREQDSLLHSLSLLASVANRFLVIFSLQRKEKRRPTEQAGRQGANFGEKLHTRSRP